MPRYEVTTPGGSAYHVDAKNSDEAKRLYCKLFDRIPSDPWTGIATLHASKIKDSRTNESPQQSKL